MTDDQTPDVQDAGPDAPPDAPEVQVIQDGDDPAPVARASQRITEDGTYLGTYPDNELDGPQYRGV